MTTTDRPSPPVRSSNFKKDAFMARGERVFRIASAPDFKAIPAVITLVDDRTGEETTETIESVIRGVSGDVPPVFAPTRKALQAKMLEHCPTPRTAPANARDLTTPRENARVQKGLIERVDASLAFLARQAVQDGKTFKKGEVLDALLAAETPVIVSSTYYKYRQRVHRTCGNEDEMAGEMVRSDRGHSRTTDPQQHLIDTVIMNYYARRDVHMNTNLLWNTMNRVWERTGRRWIDPHKCEGHAVPEDVVYELLDHRLPMDAILSVPSKAALLSPVKRPSRGWLYQYVPVLETNPEVGEEMMDRRYGKGTWDRTRRVFDHFADRAELPGQYVFADHWKVHAYIVDKDTRTIRLTLWLTMLFDACLRAPIGYSLNVRDPCIASILDALRSAIWFAVWSKDKLKALGLEGMIPYIGLIQQLFIDNALEFKSDSLAYTGRALACPDVTHPKGRYNTMDLVFRAPYNGRYGALIENHFGNLAALFDAYLRGAQRGREHTKHSLRNACLLYEDIDDFILRLMVDHWHKEHPALGMSPFDKWAETMTWVPEIPPYEEVAHLFWRKSTETRQIHAGKGVMAFGLTYASGDANKAPRLDLDGTPMEYSYSYEEDNIGCLTMSHQGITPFQVETTSSKFRDATGALKRISASEWETSKRISRERGGDPTDYLGRANEMNERNTARAKEQTRIQSARRKEKAGLQPDDDIEVAPISTPSTPIPSRTDILATFGRPTRG